MAMTGMICICMSVIVCVPFKRDVWRVWYLRKFSGMPNNYLYRCQGWCYSATFPVKYLFSRPLGGGGVPRSVNGLNIYTFDLDCMFATVLYFPWVLHYFPRFLFVLILFLTYVIILFWVCTAHFASRAMFWFLTVRPKCCGTSRRSMDHDSGEKRI